MRRVRELYNTLGCRNVLKINVWVLSDNVENQVERDNEKERGLMLPRKT